MTGSKGKNLVVALSAVAILLLVASFVYDCFILHSSITFINLIFRVLEIIPALSLLILAFYSSKIVTDKLFIIPIAGIALYNLLILTDGFIHKYLDIASIAFAVVPIVLCVATIVAIIKKENCKWFAIVFVAIEVLDVLFSAYSYFDLITYLPEYGMHFILSWLGSILSYVSVLMFYLWRSATPNEVPLTGAAAELKELVLSLRQGQITPEEFGIKRAEIISRL